MNLEIIQFMLEDWGAETVSARNGKEALDSFRQSEQNEFDYIFMDIMMPVMDGLTATEEIRRLNRPDATNNPDHCHVCQCVCGGCGEGKTGRGYRISGETAGFEETAEDLKK